LRWFLPLAAAGLREAGKAAFYERFLRKNL